VVSAGTVERGRKAFDSYAWRDAYELLSAAAAASLPPADLDRLAVAAYLIGQDAESVRAWERAHQGYVAAGETRPAVRCAVWLGLALLQGGEHARGSGWIARAQRLLEGTSLDCVEQGYVRLPRALQVLYSGDPHAAGALFSEVLDIADRFGDPDLSALCRLGCAQALIALGQVRAGVSMLDEAMVAVTAGEVSPIPAGIIYCGVIINCRDVFDLRRAQEWTAALTRWCDGQQDLKPYRGQCLVHRSEIMQLRGEWADALAEVRRAREHLADRAGDPVLGMACYQQAELFRLRGEFERAQEAYHEAADRGHTVHPGMALLRLAQGRVDEAAAAIRLAVEEADGLVARSQMLAAYVEIMLASGDVAAARWAADELRAGATALDSPLLQAVVGYADGSVLLAEADLAGASAALRRTWRHWSELAAPYEAARTRRLMGLACARAGDHDGARREWEGARQLFQRLGAAPDLVLLDLVVPDALQPAPGGPGAAGVTAQEVEVLSLVAAGRTNREIAAELVISEHTVRRHLQNIFAKLNVTSRTAATAYAYQHGLV
jgi:DNA-binding CsgD family transcriptional regulator